MYLCIAETITCLIRLFKSYYVELEYILFLVCLSEFKDIRFLILLVELDNMFLFPFATSEYNLHFITLPKIC